MSLGVVPGMSKQVEKPKTRMRKKSIMVKSAKIGPRIEYIQLKPIEGDPYKSDDPDLQKKLDAIKSLEGMWANKDTSFFDKKRK